MPKEETIELIKVKTLLGQNTDFATLDNRGSLTSKVRALVTKSYGVPQLLYYYGSLGLNSTITLDTGENYITSIFSDGTYLYAGLNTDPGIIVKIELSSFLEVDALELNADENQVTSLFSDGTYLYAGLTTTPGKIVRIQLDTFTHAGTVTLAATENIITALFTDGTYLYASAVASSLNPTVSTGKIIRISLATFTKIDTLTFAADEIACYSLFSDGLYLYCGMYTTPGKIVRVELNTFTKVDTLTFDTNEDQITCLFSDGLYLYAGLSTTPGLIVKVNIYNFGKVQTLTLNADEYSVKSLFSDGTYLYVALITQPGKIVKVDLSTFSRIGTIIFSASDSYVLSLFSDGMYLYAGLNTAPGKIVRQFIMPTTDLYQRKTDLINERTRAGQYFVYPPNAAGVTITSGAGAYTKGNYTEIIPVNTITAEFYLIGIQIYNLTVNTDYEFDISTGAATTESIVATVSGMASNTNDSKDLNLPAPIKINGNTRVSSRCSDGTGSKTAKIKLKYKATAPPVVPPTPPPPATLTRTLLKTSKRTSPGGSTASFTTGSFTPPDSSLLVVMVTVSEYEGNTTDPSVDITLTDSVGLTWTSQYNIGNIGSGHNGTWSQGDRVFTAPVAVGASMTVTVDCGAKNIFCYIVQVFAYTNYNVASPIGATATISNGGDHGALTITLSGAPAATSEVLAFMNGDYFNGPGSATPGSGWTEIADISSSDLTFTLQSQYRTASISTSVAWANINDNTGTMAKSTASAIEVKSV